MPDEPIEFDVCAQLLEMKDVEINALRRQNHNLTNRSCRSCKHFERRWSAATPEEESQLVNVCGIYMLTGVYSPAPHFYCSHWENIAGE